MSEAYTGLCKTFPMELFDKIVNDWNPWTVFTKNSVSDVWRGSGYASACLHWEKCLWWSYWLSSWKKVELLFQSLCHFYLAKVIICSYTDNCKTNEQLAWCLLENEIWMCSVTMSTRSNPKPTRPVKLKRGKLTFLHGAKFLIVCSQCKKETTYNQVANERKLIDPGLQQVYDETEWGCRLQ